MSKAQQPNASADGSQVKVWDPAVRLFHWGLVAAFAAAWFTADDYRSVHEWVGYVALGLVAFRLVWGLIGSRHARFGDFVPGPGELTSYLRRTLKHRQPRYLGHNPAAAVMILFLLLAVITIGASGWLMTTDWGWGSESLEDFHETVVNITLVAIALHVAGAIVESRHHRENLVRSMVTGYKRR